MAANCTCGSIYLQEEAKNLTNNIGNIQANDFKSITKILMTNLFDFNFEILRCYNLVIDTKILMKNIGFYSLCLMLILQIIFFIIYLVKKLNSIKHFIIKFSNINNKNKHNNMNQNKKSIIVNSNINKNNNKKRPKRKFKPNNPIKRKNILNTPNNLNHRKKMSDIMVSKSKINSSKNNSFIYRNFLSYKNAIDSKTNMKENRNKKENNIRKINNLSDKRLYSINNLNSIIKAKSNKEILKNNNIKFNGDKIKLFQTIYDMLDMNYEEAILYDKRGYFKMYWGYLVDTQIILGTFCTDNYLDLLIIKLSFLVFTFQISFFLNAFFYTDEYISDAYHNDGLLDIISGLPKSIYSYIATLITTNLLRILSNTKSELMRLIKEKQKNNKNYLYLIHEKLSKLKKKLIVYFILVFLLNLFFAYYVTAFCAVYKYSQKYWFLGCFESFGMDTLVCIIICIFLALFRFISIKKRIKCCYIFSNIISKFL